MLYYILSLERSAKNRRVYWAPGRHGYTENILQAGVYDDADVLTIIRQDINGNDIPVPLDLAIVIESNVLEHLPPTAEVPDTE